MAFATVATKVQCQCTFGDAPTPLNVVDPTRPMAGNMPMANIMDNKPMVNIMPFGTCKSLANPTVASATSAAMGVLTPMPCVPVIAAPWAPGSPTVMVCNQPALNSNSKLMCNWAGVIQLVPPGGEATVQIP